MVHGSCLLGLLALFAIATSVAGTAMPYCGLKTCDIPKEHTLCKYSPFEFNKHKCGATKSSDLTKDEIKILVDTHNKYRQLVASGQEKRGSPGPQPAARDLGPLQWDEELAKVARAWANQCDFKHDTCRNVERFQVGQNLAYQGSTGAFPNDLSTLVEQWYEEVKLFDKNQVKSVTKFNGVGHYTQMMWAKTKFVGCAIVRFNPDGVWNKIHLVCNYGPTGNWVGEQMYAPK